MTQGQETPSNPLVPWEVALENQVQLSHRRDRTAASLSHSPSPFSQWQHQHLLERNGANFQVGMCAHSLGTEPKEPQMGIIKDAKKGKGLRELAASPEGGKAASRLQGVSVSHFALDTVVVRGPSPLRSVK